MKFTFSFLCVLSLITTTIYSQAHQVYSGVGYNIPTTTAVLGNTQTDNSFQQNISTFSEGIVYQGGYQFAVNNNFILDLNINYLSGLTDEKYQIDSDGGYLSYTNSNISISPSINIKFDVGSFSPYTKFGFSINFISLDIKRESGNILSNVSFDFSYKSNYTLGLVGGIGVNFRFDKSFVGFVEAQLNSFTYYPDELKLTENFSNGAKITTIYQLEEKVDEASNDDNIIPSQDFPYSSVGIIVGLRIVL